MVQATVTLINIKKMKVTYRWRPGNGKVMGSRDKLNEEKKKQNIIVFMEKKWKKILFIIIYNSLLILLKISGENLCTIYV